MRYAQAHSGSDIDVRIPRDYAAGSRLQRVERAVRWLWSRGVYPGPAAVGLRLRGRASRTLNGFETSVRNRMLKELGISRQRRYKVDPETGRPAVCVGIELELRG